MRHRLLLLLPALQEVLADDFRVIKYSLFPPLGLLTLAGLTPEDRYDITVRDDNVEPTRLCDDFDLVGMTVYSSSARRAYALADQYRRRGAKVVLGGLHPTALPEEAARHADAVCIGPGEPVWPDILRDFERNSLSKFYRASSQGSVSLTGIPRRDLMNSRFYLTPNTMVTSRGCPHACEFCYKARFWGRHFYRRRPLADIERELASFRGGAVFILDDNFLGHVRQAREVLPLLRASGLVWQAGASLDVVRDPSLLDEAYDAGCRSLFMGFESLLPDNMRRAHKLVNFSADYRDVIRRVHDSGIMINGSFMFGFDQDSPDVFERTVDFAVDNRLETATFHILTPFPGTRAFDRLDAEGRILHRDWSRYDAHHAVFRPRRMSVPQLEEGYRRAYSDFYTFGSILHRSLGTRGAVKRVLYNLGWKRTDRLWSAAIHLGLLPFIRPVFESVLARHTRPRLARQPEGEGAAPHAAPAGSRNPSSLLLNPPPEAQY